MRRHVKVHDWAELSILPAPAIRWNWYPEQFIVLDLEGIEAGHPNLKASNPL